MISLYTDVYEGVWFGVAYDNKSVFATAFGLKEEQVLHSLLESIPFDIPFQYSTEGTVFANEVIATLRDVYNGIDVYNKFYLFIKCLSYYAQKVLEATAQIPVGYVTSYGAISKTVGGSPRSVGRVMALNPFPLIIPCHRVVTSDFSLGGYGGGLQVKLEILSREKRGRNKGEEIPIGERKLKIFPVELVLQKFLNKR